MIKENQYSILKEKLLAVYNMSNQIGLPEFNKTQERNAKIAKRAGNFYLCSDGYRRSSQYVSMIR